MQKKPPKLNRKPVLVGGPGSTHDVETTDPAKENTERPKKRAYTFISLSSEL